MRRQLTRRERQVMDILYRREEATAAEVQERLPDPPTNSAVRSLLRILEEKGHVTHRRDGPRYVYMPTVSREKARRSALQHLVDTFFGGSAGHAVATLLDERGEELSDEEFERLSALIQEVREEDGDD